MYHPTVVARKIDKAIAAKRISQPPTYHTRAEFESIRKHLDTIYDREQGEWTRPLDHEELQFIKEQRFLCRIDYNYWKTRTCWILDRTDRPVRYEPWVSQQILCDIFAENELEGIGIELQSLKARQLGVSRETSLAQLHRIQFYSHINAVLASSTPIKTGKLADMMLFTMDYQPHWLMPKFAGGPRDGAQRNGGDWFDFDTGAGVTLQSGSQVSGLARGTTPTMIHVSELAEFEGLGLGPEELIDSSLFMAVHPDARIFMMLESTAQGVKNWWHRKWQSSKAGWSDRTSRLRPVFLPWYVGTKDHGYVYPEKGFLLKSPVPHDFKPVDWAIDHARRAEEFVRSNDLLRRYMGEAWTMPIEQIWYYQVSKQQAINEDRLSKFLGEMPGSDDEAFQSTGITIFGTETISTYRDRTRNPVGVYGLVGPDMTPRTILFSRNQIDQTKPIVNIQYEWGPNPRTYQLIPLIWQGYSLDTGQDKIYIWEWPEDGQVYGLGGDTSDGIGLDRSCLEVLRKGNPWQNAGQVAEFASDKINALDLTPYAMALAALYSVHDTDGLRRQCRSAIECRGKGDLTQLAMKLDGWSNFHPWMRPDNKVTDLSKYNKIGIYTTQWFRESIQEYLTKMVKDLEIDIRSPYVVEEMQSLKPANLSFKTQHKDDHDDRIMSLGFVIISLYQWEPNRPVSAMKPTEQSMSEIKSAAMAPKRFARWTPSDQERDNSAHVQHTQPDPRLR